MSDIVPQLVPVSLRSPEERYAHVVQRLNERGGILWDPCQVAALEQKIKFCRSQINLQKPVAPILPTKIAEAKEGQVHHYRVKIAGESHTFIWSQIAKGLISYIGKGEILPPPVEMPIEPKGSP